MAEFEDPFNNPYVPPLCDPTPCPDCIETPDIDDCFICGYPSGSYEACRSVSTPVCIDGSASCLDCEDFFQGFNTTFLGGYVSGFNSRLGFGASESNVNIDLVFPKYRCPEPTISGTVGVCCEPDGSCSTLYSDSEDCENAGGTWKSGKTCDDNPCCPECPQEDPKYEGKIGHIYTFRMAAFCFRGILNNHNYSEDNSGYRYRVSLIDGRSVLNNMAVLLNNSYSKLPSEFANNAISVNGDGEDSVSTNDCGNGRQCKDFMLSSGGHRGIKIKKALEQINKKCVSIPVSNAGLVINVDKLIAIVSDELRTTNSESTVLELITLACDESGYDFFVKINNDNEFEVVPVNYRKPATEKSLFSFIEDLSSKDIVISKEYGEEMAGGSQKNKRIVFGNNLSYLTSVRDYPVQLDCNAYIPEINTGICCEPDGSCSNAYVDKEDCNNAGGTWYSYAICDNEPCSMQPPCSIKNNPASIGAYDTFYITPTPYPGSC